MRKLFLISCLMVLFLGCALTYSPDPRLDGVWKYEYRSGDNKYDVKELTFKNNTLGRFLTKNDYYYIDAPESSFYWYVYTVSGSNISFLPTDGNFVATGNPWETYNYSISGDILTINGTEYKKQ